MRRQAGRSCMVGRFYRHSKTWTGAFGQQAFKRFFLFVTAITTSSRRKRFVNQYDLVSARDATYAQGCVEANNSLALVCQGMMPLLILLLQPLTSHMLCSIRLVGNRPHKVSCVVPASAPQTMPACVSLNLLMGNWMDLVLNRQCSASCCQSVFFNDFNRG